MKIAICCDAFGLEVAGQVVGLLQVAGHEVLHFGVDGPDDSRGLRDCTDAVCAAVVRGEAERGILVCKSGGYPLIRANRWPGIRAVMGWSAEAMHHDRQASDVNVMALSGGYGGVNVALVLEAFLNTAFEALERRVIRLAQLEEKPHA